MTRHRPSSTKNEVKFIFRKSFNFSLVEWLNVRKVCSGCILHFRRSMPLCGVRLWANGQIPLSFTVNWNFWFHHRASVWPQKRAPGEHNTKCFTLHRTNLFEFVSLSLLFTINLNINLIRIFRAKHFRAACWCVCFLRRSLLRTLHSSVVHFF